MSPRWPAFATRPGGGGLVSWPEHAVAAALALMVTGVAGFLVMAGAAALPDTQSETALALMLAGAVLGFSVAFAWVGFLLLVPLCRVLLDMGWAGWCVFPLAGGLIGFGLEPVVESAAAVVVGPILAAIYAFILRRRVPAAFAPR